MRDCDNLGRCRNEIRISSFDLRKWIGVKKMFFEKNEYTILTIIVFFWTNSPSVFGTKWAETNGNTKSYLQKFSEANKYVDCSNAFNWHTLEDCALHEKKKIRLAHNWHVQKLLLMGERTSKSFDTKCMYKLNLQILRN